MLEKGVKVNRIKFIEARNLSVHDYFGLDNEGFLKLTKDLIKLVKKDLK